MTQHTTGYLIHKDGRGWYRPGAAGYTLDSDEAGRFSRIDAFSYSHPNGKDGPRDGITFKHESEVPSGENCEKDLRIHDLILERDSLRAAQEQMSKDNTALIVQIENLEARLRGVESAADTIARACL